MIDFLEEREEALRRALEEQEAEERERAVLEKEDIGVKAEHASKMTAKWEKITAKEAKKAEKDGAITSKNRWQLIEMLATEYLAGK